MLRGVIPVCKHRDMEACEGRGTEFHAFSTSAQDGNEKKKTIKKLKTRNIG